jgi:SP family general alpha glucoside:H+ symporter-like MFS transporter
MATTADQDLESKIQHNVDHTDVYDEKAGISAYKAGAIEAENAEHNMTVLEAVRAYPPSGRLSCPAPLYVLLEHV